MAIEFQNRLFETTLCSDSEPDSMYLEIVERRAGKDAIVFEIRYFEGTGAMTFSAFEQDLPFELIEHYAMSARAKLTPVVATDR